MNLLIPFMHHIILEIRCLNYTESVAFPIKADCISRPTGQPRITRPAARAHVAIATLICTEESIFDTVSGRSFLASICSTSGDAPRPPSFLMPRGQGCQGARRTQSEGGMETYTSTTKSCKHLNISVCIICSIFCFTKYRGDKILSTT